ncbi:hypothetical protein SAMN05216188_119146 [Lentzea xinjiangensis]|uniref:YD repeat-containing protein n=1 Tax=Lentzea xinjiangensis TaxID=402600 RepID=A0A1H9TYE2_9PSEU|nr:hypothetical protein [Lentzea xinjiangensis]SES02038.1 hypothetical protein SAMN05216188_119146 [Lentzea xinjiangensis]
MKTLLIASLLLAPAPMTWSTVNSESAGDQDNASVSATRNGYTAVVWEDDRDSTDPADPLHSDVWIRLYKEGTSVYEKKLSSGGTGNWRHWQPDVSLHENGTAVVVWSEDADGNGYYNIAVRSVSASGTVSGSGRANASADGQQHFPSVAADPDTGGFAVVWEDQQGTGPSTVRVGMFASISSKSYEAQLNNAGGTHAKPQVAMGAAGNAVVVWEADAAVARKIVTPSGGVKQAQTTTGQGKRPAVAASFNGDFAVAWEQSGVRSRSFTAAGAARGTADAVTTGADPQIGIDDQLGVAVTTAEAQDVHTQVYNPDGTTTQLTVSTATGRQDEPAVGVDPWGRITVVYTDDNDGNGFDQIYQGTGLSTQQW